MVREYCNADETVDRQLSILRSEIVNLPFFLFLLCLLHHNGNRLRGECVRAVPMRRQPCISRALSLSRSLASLLYHYERVLIVGVKRLKSGRYSLLALHTETLLERGGLHKQ